MKTRPREAEKTFGLGCGDVLLRQLGAAAAATAPAGAGAGLRETPGTAGSRPARDSGAKGYRRRSRWTGAAAAPAAAGTGAAVHGGARRRWKRRRRRSLADAVPGAADPDGAGGSDGQGSRPRGGRADLHLHRRRRGHGRRRELQLGVQSAGRQPLRLRRRAGRHARRRAALDVQRRQHGQRDHVTADRFARRRRDPVVLLRATSTSGTGLFSDVSYVQRLNTTGGKAPAPAAMRRRSGWSCGSATRPSTTSTRAAPALPRSPARRSQQRSARG